MKKNATVVLLLSAFLLSGCDFLRTLAGRPSSSDINRMRMEITAAERSERLEQEALAAMKEAAEVKEGEAPEDYVPVMDSLRRKGVPVYTGSRMRGVLSEGLDRRFYIVTGSFKDSANAERLSSKYAAKGYDSRVIRFGSGYDGVSAGAFNRLSEADEARKSGMEKGDFPKDTWILVID